MAIILRLDRVMADRKISLKELSERVGVANVHLSKLKTGKVSAIRFSTLDAICEVLECQPGDILEYKKGYCISKHQLLYRQIFLNDKDKLFAIQFYIKIDNLTRNCKFILN